MANDIRTTEAEGGEADRRQRARQNARLVYILYLVGIVFWPIAIVGLVFAYLNREGAEAWVANHYLFQIRSFWIGLLYIVVSGVTAFMLIGWLVAVAALIWWIVRCAKGIHYLGEQKPYPKPDTWLW